MIALTSRLLLRVLRPDRVAAFGALMKAQWLPADEIAADAGDRLIRILRHACRQTPYYRDFCARAGLDPATLDGADLHRFPLMDKAALMERRERFLAAGTDRADLVANFTGGSSGTPFEFFSDRRALERRKANDWRGRTWTGWNLGDKQALLWAHPGDNRASASLRGRLLADWVHRTRTLDAYDMNEAVLRAFHAELAAYRPAMLLGFSSSLAFLAEYLLRRELALPAPRGIISSAETLSPEQREVIEARFDCLLLNRYGSREFGVMAQQCEQVGGLHVFTDQVHLEILAPDGTPCAPGQRGEIVVTDLDNRAMPFIRYRTGDLARWSAEPCPCGRGFPLLETVEGRTSELLVGKNGKFYSCLGPRFFGGDIPGIRQMQVVQESLDEIRLRIVQGPDWSEEGAARLCGRLVELLGDVRVVIEAVDEIPPAPSGKFPFTISRVSPFGPRK